VPPAIAKASFKKQEKNTGVTDYTEMEGRGHSLTIDNGWQDVADTVLEFARRFVPASPNPARDKAATVR
jgi:non-heme chloroperoxidase